MLVRAHHRLAGAENDIENNHPFRRPAKAHPQAHSYFTFQALS